MLVKVDEDLPQAAVQVLRVHGYDAVSVVEQGMGGAKDPDLWQVVQAEARFLVTADKGFGDIRSYLPGTHHGVLLLRPDQDGIQPVTELLERMLAVYRLEPLTGTVTVVTPRGVRIRQGRPQSSQPVGQNRSLTADCTSLSTDNTASRLVRAETRFVMDQIGLAPVKGDSAEWFLGDALRLGAPVGGRRRRRGPGAELHAVWAGAVAERDGEQRIRVCGRAG